MSAYAAYIQIISEDSSEQAPYVSREVVRHIICLTDSCARTNRLALMPLDPDSPGAIAAHANKWRSESPEYYNARRELINAIVSTLAIDNGFVFFHVDGDRPWRDRKSAQVINEFERKIRTPVRQRLQGDGKDPEKALKKLFLMVPFYSIEAWLYQNVDKAILLCHRRFRGQDVAQFRSYAKDRGLLDEVVKPKEQICLSNKYNKELVGGFPRELVYGAGKSFAAVVDMVGDSKEFVDALRATYA